MRGVVGECYRKGQASPAQGLYVEGGLCLSLVEVGQIPPLFLTVIPQLTAST